MINIIIADDHQIVIDGLKLLLADEERIQIVGEALNGVTLLNRIPTLQPDLVLLDLGMPVMDGLEAALKIKELHPTVKILVLTTYSEPHKIKKMLKANIDGYLLKDTGKDNLLEAIYSIMDGNAYYDRRVTDIIMSSYQPQKTTYSVELTRREKEVTRLIAEGMSTNEIARRLFVSPLTVDTHRKNIFSKLGINKVAALVRYAIEEGLVE
ncbi:response regulator [Aureispira anguillae]|uniref:Response regulator transcription factor n=1 Tax=Aureispira anguillae TaxID=2864201 RepID=A0A915YGX0_9BACT|nr:response regulator transcription factor [Aureispira anguillae]BDS12943.1 response regulator transcription factor [Aureispira anguillae]